MLTFLVPKKDSKICFVFDARILNAKKAKTPSRDIVGQAAAALFAKAAEKCPSPSAAFFVWFVLFVVNPPSPHLS